MISTLYRPAHQGHPHKNPVNPFTGWSEEKWKQAADELLARIREDEERGSGLDNLPWSERKQYCYCKEGQTHCGVCASCGKPGHVRSLMMFTGGFCDACYSIQSKEVNE